MKYVLLFPPIPAPRPRVSKFGTYYPKTYKTWQARAVTELTTQHRGQRSFCSAVHIQMTFVMTRPQRLMRKKDENCRVIHDRKPDLDNLQKSVLDALTKSAILLDDSLVCSCTAEKYYADKTEPAHIEIHIQEKCPGE